MMLTSGAFVRTPGALRALIATAIDYAGLFPPAKLGMTDAVDAYAAYRGHPASWALGRFVVPASRLDELADVLRQRNASSTAVDPWPLSVLIGADARRDLAHVDRYDARNAHDTGLVVQALELRATTTDEARELLALAPSSLERYVEIPIDGDPTPLLLAIRDGGAMAKARTGGVTVDAFPSAAVLARFIASCTRLGVPFKATAGLHHLLRAEYSLTYEPASERGTMFGYLNVFLAAAFLREGLDEADAVALLEERDVTRIRFDATGAWWRGRQLTLQSIEATRRQGVRAFGSCSFREPVDELLLLTPTGPDADDDG